ncbi:dihydroorotate dehydrogenase electron transfer subunit [Marinococcus halophilus]|uniref:Dihydroorotate dehydrogenase B (NAD(+)), electron transfer subunit n=1 Tax=Marinococcus halophilus TaxID=1371 RepID=A0A510Y1Y3_MARHA|nr:dihydroorotate dehydrogenase electron transfer subunit [Marinococcus halophilus]OZT81382.1 dihydroorotate dehydrogenase electron transfer subunit [Marinococcus halophilus]GEK57335.1 dihydroorotate dehydrogenase B (NAD(+)), electron transfer subunit [Marinococcus halophilus]
MIQKEWMTVVSIDEIAASIFEVVLEGDMPERIGAPGQFVHVKTSPHVAPLLRRPVSISEYWPARRRMALVFRSEGEGTSRMAAWRAGDEVDVLGPLGNGFDTSDMNEGEKALIVGGGVGVPPLLGLAKQLAGQGIRVQTVLGFANASSTFFQKRFSSLGDCFVSTIDGSIGEPGFVTDVIDRRKLSYDAIYACGPLPMLRALDGSYATAKGKLSLEERMGCGIGACFACVCHTADDPEGTSYRKVCSDGPVFPWGEVVLS